MLPDRITKVVPALEVVVYLGPNVGRFAKAVEVLGDVVVPYA